MTKDFLDEMIEEGEGRWPGFTKKINKAAHRQKIKREQDLESILNTRVIGLVEIGDSEAEDLKRAIIDRLPKLRVLIDYKR